MDLSTNSRLRVNEITLVLFQYFVYVDSCDGFYNSY